jgi:rare lipoprotein A
VFALNHQERIIRASLSPYTVKNITYYPHKLSVGESKEILASWYGEYFHGRLTALGEVYDMNGISAAHKTYPLGTVLKVTNPANGKSLNVRINDRGPFWGNRELDLSKGAATYLETKEKGVAPVKIEVVSVPDIARSDTPVEARAPKVVVLKALSKKKIIISSYAFLAKDETNVPIEFGRFKKLSKAKRYEAELKRYLHFSYILKYKNFYGIKSFLPAKKSKAKKILKRLKTKGLIENYELFWSYK